MTETTCRCGQPTRDHAPVCETCADKLARALGEVPAVAAMIETTIARRKGVDYRRVGGGKGGKREQPSPPEWGAAEARDHLRGVLVAWVRFAWEENVRHSSPHVGLPVDTLPAMARWLMWRVDGLALHEIGAEAVDEVTSAVAHCLRLVDARPEKLYAGTCGAEGDEATCSTDLYARPGSPTIQCPGCATMWDVKERRAYLLAEAEEVLATAVEISRAVSWLGAEPLTADRVRQWAARGRLTARGHVTEDGRTRPTYRVGDAIDLLSATTMRKDGAA